MIDDGSFRNESHNRFITGFFRFVWRSFSNDVLCPFLSEWGAVFQWQSLGKGSALLSEWRSSDCHFGRKIRFVMDLPRIYPPTSRFGMKIDDSHIRKKIRFLLDLFLIYPSFRWLALLPHFGSRGDFPLVISEWESSFLSFQKESFRQKNVCSTPDFNPPLFAWFFERKSAFRNGKFISKKLPKSYHSGTKIIS